MYFLLLSSVLTFCPFLFIVIFHATYCIIKINSRLKQPSHFPFQIHLLLQPPDHHIDQLLFQKINHIILHIHLQKPLQYFQNPLPFILQSDLNIVDF